MIPLISRRRLLSLSGQSLGGLAFARLLDAESRPELPHFPPKAKRAIYLHMVGAPPQQETFDYKPKMEALFDQDLPESIRQGQRLTTMTSGQSRFPIVPSIFKFARHGQCGAEISELLPYTARMADDICVIRSMHTEAINHDPAITFFQTGHQIAGRPSFGAWLSYGLGSANENLPAFVADFQAVLEDHVAHCVEEAIASGDPEAQRRKVAELIEVFGRADR